MHFLFCDYTGNDAGLTIYVGKSTAHLRGNYIVNWIQRNSNYERFAIQD